MTTSGKGGITQVASSVPVDDTNLTDPADNVQEALENVSGGVAVSASPGYSYGRSGNVSKGAFLYRPGSVPSNITGIPIGIVDPYISNVSIGNQRAKVIKIDIWEHDGNGRNLSFIGSVTTDGTRTYSATVNFTLITGKQIAISVASDSPNSGKNVGVDLQIKGTTV